MLDKAIQEEIVVEYSDIFAYSYNSQLMSLSEMPYFEGDYWPNVLEDLLKEESAADLMLEEELRVPDAIIEKPQQNGFSKKRKLKKISTNSNSKRRRQSDAIDSNSSTNGNTNGNNDIMKRLFDNLERRKENFFVIRLHSQSDASKLPNDLIDSDCNGMIRFNSDLMDGRDKFLALSRDKHLEFSSLRRAKFATLSLCYELHLELRNGVIYSCNNCDVVLDSIRFTCRVCDEFELCVSCVGLLEHVHKLYRVAAAAGNGGAIDSGAPDGPLDAVQEDLGAQGSLGTQGGHRGPGEEAAATQQDEAAIKRQKSIGIIKMYEHADKCRDASCKIPNCVRFRRIPDHTIDCAKKNERMCKFCKQIFNIIREHQRDCRNTDCRLEVCVRKRNRGNSNQTRLYNLASDRRRMQSAAVTINPGAMVPIAVPMTVPIHGIAQQHQPQQHVMLTAPPQATANQHMDHSTFQTDIYVIRSFIEQMKRDPNIIPQDYEKRLLVFLNSNPRYKEAWKQHSMQRQQISYQQQQQQQQVQRFPQAVFQPQQQYYQQHVHPMMQQYRPSPQQPHQSQPPPQCYVIQTRPQHQQQQLPPVNQSNQLFYTSNNNNTIQFHQQQQQQHSTNSNTQLQNFHPS